MNRFLSSVFCLVFLAGFLLVENAVPAASDSDDSHPLEGMVFIGYAGPKGEDADGEDQIIFRDGLFLSTSCVKYGFETAPYTAVQKTDGIHFESVVVSPDHGVIEWKGVVRDDRAEATFLWTKKRWYWFDAHEESWFEGKLKAP